MSTTFKPIAELPPFLLKPYSKSRLNNHIQTLLYVQMYDRAAARFFEIGLAENVVSTRTRMGGIAGKWTKFNDQPRPSHEDAVAFALGEAEKYESRGYRSVTNSGILMPLNETDVRYLRRHQTLSRAAMEHASQLFDSILQWVMSESDKAMATAVAAAPPPSPTTYSSARMSGKSSPTSASSAESLAKALDAFSAAKASDPKDFEFPKSGF